MGWGRAARRAWGAGSMLRPPELRPLRVSGIVIGKADLIEALRAYVPALCDLQVTQDGEHFWLMLDRDGVGQARVPDAGQDQGG